ncbi:MAG: Rnf-Nqr domain containing protein [Oscillospiraceae bacterium]
MSDKKSKVLDGIKTSAIIKNPVLFEAIGIAPVVAMAISLKSAIILSVVSFAELFIIEMISCLMLKKVKGRYRMAIYAVLGVMINIPLFMVFKRFAPNETANVGIFLPLMAVNSLIALHCERFAVRNSPSETAVDAISAGASYAFVILIIGIIREVIGSGTLYSFKLHLPVQLSGLLMPFGGFLILGFFAAILKSIIAKKYPDEHPEDAFSFSEISESHIGKIKNLMDSDFNPYDETEIPENYDEEKQRHKKEKKIKLPQIAKEEKINGKKKKAIKKSSKVKVSQAVSLEKKRDDYSSEFNDILAELSEHKAQSDEKDGDGDDNNQ